MGCGWWDGIVVSTLVFKYGIHSSNPGDIEIYLFSVGDVW